VWVLERLIVVGGIPDLLGPDTTPFLYLVKPSLYDHIHSLDLNSGCFLITQIPPVVKFHFVIVTFSLRPNFGYLYYALKVCTFFV